MSSDHEAPAGSPFSAFSPAERRAWFAYMRLQLRLRYEMNHQLRVDSGLSLADFDVLVALAGSPDGRLGISALSTEIGWERSRASHHAARMAKRGLVTMGRSRADRRVTEVELTGEGRRTFTDASSGHLDLVRSMFFADLDSAALESLSASLETVYERVLERGTLPAPGEV